MQKSSRITRYVLTELAPPTLLGLALYTFVLLMNAFFLIAEKAISQGYGWEITLRLILYELPKLLVLTIPMATLLGTLIGLGRLSADHEWVAMQGAGLGVSSLLRPVAIHGLIAAAISLFIYGMVFPRTNYAYRELWSEVARSGNLAADLRPRIFYDNLPDTVLYVDEIKAGTQGRLEGVLIHRSKAAGGFDQLILARSGDLSPSREIAGGLDMMLYDGVLHSYKTYAPDTYRVFRFETYQLEFGPPEFLQAFQGPVNRTDLDRGLVELYRELRALPDQPDPVIRQLRSRRIRAELHQRFALPAAAFLFAILAVPLGITRVRSGKGAGFALSLIVVVLYWVVFTFTRDQATQGRVPVALAVWAANIVILLWFLIALWRLRRPRPQGGLLVAASRGGLHLFRRGWSAISRPPKAPVPSPRNADGSLAGGRGGTAVRFPWLQEQHFAYAYARIFLLGLATAYVVYVIVVFVGPSENLLQYRSPAAVLHALLRLSVKGLFNFVLPVGLLIATAAAFLAILDRRISLLYLRVLGLAVASTYIVYAVVELKNLVEGALRNHQPLSRVFEYFKYFTPGMLNLVLPISCLVAAVVAYTLLARKGELTAVMASGISLRRATVPVLVVTLGLSAVFFLVQDHIVPLTSSKAQEIKDELLGRAPHTYGLAPGGRWTFGSGNRLYHYRLYDPEAKTFQGLSVFTLDRKTPSILEQRFSNRAKWDGSRWQFEDGWFRSIPGDGSVGDYRRYQRDEPVALDPPENFARRELSLTAGVNLPEQMSLVQLREQIQSLEDSGYDTTRLRVSYFAKLAHPLTPLVMVLLGLPFAFRIGRRGSLYGIGVALILVIVYWATFAVFNALGLETLLPPFLAAWAPNILYSLTGLYLLLYVRT